MQLGMVGLGRMGANMVRRLLRGGHECVVFDVRPKPSETLAKEGAVGPASLADFMKKLKKPRVAWLMVPAAVVEKTLADLLPAARSGRHPGRRRQLLLRRRYPPRQGAAREGHPLRRFGHQRRRLGTRARLLPDDRRRKAVVAASRSDFRHARAWHRRHRRAPRHARKLAPAPPSTATCIAGPTAPATSSRWCTTASSTA